MAIQTATNFNINTGLPIDSRTNVKTLADRNAIPVGVRYPYMKTTVEEDGETYILVGGLDNDCWVRESAKSTAMGAYKWNVNSEANPLIDEVFILKDNAWESTGKTLKEFENDNYNGTWFYVGNGSTDVGLTRYKMIEDGYTTTGYHIDGADGYLNCRDYIIWNGRWVRFNVYEAKASEVKNADGKYSPKSGVCGLMSSTQAAYLTDLISEYWDKEKLSVYSTPNPPEGWQTNLLFNTGWYLGGIKKDCDGHPPVVNGHHTSWAVLVLNGMATDAESLNHNHRLQLAFDVVNSKVYMRRGWMSENTWADNWDEVGAVADGSITENKLTSSLTSLINETAAKAHTHNNKSVLDNITAKDIETLNSYSEKNLVEQVTGLTPGTIIIGYDETTITTSGVTIDKLKENTITVRGSINANNKVTSEDTDYNKDIDIVPAKVGDAFDVSEDLTSWWGTDGYIPKKGDLIVSMGTNAASSDNWRIIRGEEAFADLEEKIKETTVGAIVDGSITAAKLSSDLASEINEAVGKAHSHINKNVLDGITETDIANWGNTAPPIECTAEGEVITIPDSAELPLKGLTVYGKSTQGDVPTPETPVDIVSVGDNGSIAVTITDGTENANIVAIATDGGLRGIPVTSGGNYTDESGQQWICDTVEFSSDGTGKIVRRIGVVNNNSWYGTTVSSGGGYQYRVIVNDAKKQRNIPIMCSNFPVKTDDSDSVEGDYITSYHMNNGRISIRTSLAGFKAWTAETDMKTYYILAEPTETPLTAEEVAVFKELHTYHPTTTVTNDAGAYMNVVYIADTKMYVESVTDTTYSEIWKDEPALTIEITEDCAAIDVTEINGKPFSFERLGGYAELAPEDGETNTAAVRNNKRMCIILNKTSGASYNGLVCMSKEGVAEKVQRGIFEVKREFDIWHTSGVSSGVDTWLALNNGVDEHWDVINKYFSNVKNITSFRLIPYSGNFHAGTVIKIYGKAARE